MTLTASAALEARRVTVALGDATILSQVDLQIRYGQTTIVIGPNGAGKSTLLHVLTGSVSPRSGDVLCDGKPLSQYAARNLAAQRAVMLQDTSVAFSYTVRDVVTMGCRAESDREPDELVDEAMSRTEIAHLQARDVTTLSGGERARVALARVLAQDARIVLLDEPTAALDVQHQEQVMGLCHELASEGRAVVVVAHDLDLAFVHADQVVVVDGGRIAACGPVDQLRDSELLGEVYGWPIDVFAHGGRQIVTPRRVRTRGSKTGDRP